jgi:UDP-2,3-diacylglucosamine hydrolase
MILFVSDMHFGRGDAATCRVSEAALLDCLDAHAADVEALYLVGDVFEHYIEYPTLVPKGFVRFQALLAAWTDRGMPVTYLVGNHDPWHQDYFETELGVRVVPDGLLEPLRGRTVYLEHGDRLAPGSWLYRWLRPLLRHPLPVTLYRTLLPGDAGLRLARWSSHRFGGRPVDERVATTLRHHADRLLRNTSADLVVMGHSHSPERRSTDHGLYLNTGSWHYHRTFGRLDADGVRLLRWAGARAEVLAGPPLPAAI